MALVWDPYSQTWYDDRSLSNANIAPYGSTPSLGGGGPGNIPPGNIPAGNPRGGLSGLFSGLRGRIGAGKALFGTPKINWEALKSIPRDIRATQVFEGGPTLGNVGAAGMGAYQGIKAIQGLSENAQSDADYNDLINSVKSSAYANPMAAQYLTADQRKTLRQAKSGSFGASNWAGAAQGAAQGIPKALLSTVLGGLMGGAPGAIVGGLGSLGNAAIQGYGNRTREQTSQLSGLYDALQNAELSYNDEAGQRIRNRHFNYMY